MGPYFKGHVDFGGGVQALLRHETPRYLFCRCYECTQKIRYTTPFGKISKMLFFSDALMRHPTKMKGKQAWIPTDSAFGRWAII